MMMMIMAFTWWWVISYLGYLKVHFTLIKYTCDSKSQTLRMRYLFQSTGRPISHRNGWSFRVCLVSLRDFVPELNFRSGTTTWVNSRRGDLIRRDILWWYHENECRAMKGNRSELASARKSPRCHVNTPVSCWNSEMAWSMSYVLINLSSPPKNRSVIAKHVFKKPIVFTTSVSIEF